MASFALRRPFTITNVKPARPRPLFPSPTSPFLLSLLASFSLIFVLRVLSPPSTLFPPLSLPPSLPDFLHWRGGDGPKNKMFTFNFTFHVPNPFSMSALTTVANVATDAFNSVATDIREDPELLNYMVAGLGPGGVAGGFGYDSNRLVKPPPHSTSSASRSSPASPKSRGLKGSQNRQVFGPGLANPPRKRHSQGHERNQGDFRGSTSGFVNINPPPGSGTPIFPTQIYSQSSSYVNPSVGAHGFGQGTRNRVYPLSASRKRGWVPALSEPSYASTNEDFTTGFLDAPKYRNVDQMEGVDSQSGCGMGSGAGDHRRKWDDEYEEESESAMEAGEFFLLLCFPVGGFSSFLPPLTWTPCIS